MRWSLCKKMDKQTLLAYRAWEIDEARKQSRDYSISSEFGVLRDKPVENCQEVISETSKARTDLNSMCYHIQETFVDVNQADLISSRSLSRCPADVLIELEREARKYLKGLTALAQNYADLGGEKLPEYENCKAYLTGAIRRISEAYEDKAVVEEGWNRE